METMDTLLLMPSLMAASSLIPTEVQECGGKLNSQVELLGFGKSKSSIEGTAVDQDFQECKL